jgi:CHASE2 domain-containing sensor protein
MVKNFTISDILVGIPAGLLIFMSSMAFSALLRQRGVASNWLELLILAADSAIVGLLIRVSRKKRALPTALASGVIGALVILFLWISSPQNAALNPLVFGLPGMAVAFGFCVLVANIVPAR